MKNVAIIDTTVVSNFLEIKQINLIDALQNLFEFILFPEEIKREIENYAPGKLPTERANLLRQIRIDKGFYRLCNSHDQVLFSLLTTFERIDKGEAEAIAQAQHRQVYTILTDDKPCIQMINESYSHIRCFNTLTLLAYLDIQQLLHNRNDILKELMPILNFRSKDLRASYLQIAKYLSIQLDKKDLSKKTSIKELNN